MTMIATFKKNFLHNAIRPGWRNSTRGRDRVGWWNLFWARNACTKSTCCTIIACHLHEGWNLWLIHLQSSFGSLDHLGPQDRRRRFPHGYGCFCDAPLRVPGPQRGQSIRPSTTRPISTPRFLGVGPQCRRWTSSRHGQKWYGFRGIFFQDFSMMMILIPGKAWQFVLFSLFLLLTVRILLTSSWPGQFWNFVFPWGGEKNRYLNFQNELSGFQRCCVGALVQKKHGCLAWERPSEGDDTSQSFIDSRQPEESMKGRRCGMQRWEAEVCQRFARFLLRFPLLGPALAAGSLHMIALWCLEDVHAGCIRNFIQNFVWVPSTRRSCANRFNKPSRCETDSGATSI